MLPKPIALGLLIATPCPATPPPLPCTLAAIHPAPGALSPSAPGCPSTIYRRRFLAYSTELYFSLTVVGTPDSPPRPTCWLPSFPTNASIYGTVVPAPLKPPCYRSSLYVVAHQLPYALFVLAHPISIAARSSYYVLNFASTVSSQLLLYSSVS